MITNGNKGVERPRIRYGETITEQIRGLIKIMDDRTFYIVTL